MRRIGLTQFLIEQQREQRISADLRLLIEVVARAVKAISVAVGKGALADVLGEAGSDNVQGEAQKKLDVIANEILLEANEWGGHLAAMASEEMDDPHVIPSDYPKGGYLLLFDPLDGSSNIDVNVSVGTIFSVLRCPDNAQNPADAVHFLQPARRSWRRATRVWPIHPARAYGGRRRARLHPGREMGSFVMTQSHLRIPADTREYAINASNAAGEAPVRRYVEELEAGQSGPRERDFNMRWVGSMVADVHRILTRGGIFMYPRDSKDPAKPGKLRLMYEANPMAMLVDQAGGAATTGRERILALEPQQLHQRVPVILGSKNEVERVTGYHGE